MEQSVIAVFDANILYPAPLRDLFIRIAQAGLVLGRWSETIHDEWTRNVLKDNPNILPERLARRSGPATHLHLPGRRRLPLADGPRQHRLWRLTQTAGAGARTDHSTLRRYGPPDRVREVVPARTFGRHATARRDRTGGGGPLGCHL